MKFKTIRLGIELFLTKENFKLWLDTHHLAMGGKKPIECTWEEVFVELKRIEFGTLA